MNILITAIVSCIPLLLLSGVVLLLTWKNRGRIESIEISARCFKIQFGKSGRQR